MPRPTSLPAWIRLAALASTVGDKSMRGMFADDPGRFEAFSLGLDDLLLDYSKNRIDAEVFGQLVELAEQAGVADARAAMFSGETINATEGRAVLHVALRNRTERAMAIDGADVMPRVRAVLSKMKDFSDGVRAGRWRGATGKAIANVVNIGIGGSDLGPAMVVEALRPYQRPDLTVRFLSNVDGSHAADILGACDPETTLFVVVSKTFSTQETLMNAATCRKWLVDRLGEGAVAKHFVAVSSNSKAVAGFGIDADNMFEFWDWVGGRYSLWSAVGLSVAVAVGFDRFEELLEGAFAMDEHFRTAPLGANMPVILALLGVWNGNFLDARAHAVLPMISISSGFPPTCSSSTWRATEKAPPRTGPWWIGGPVPSSSASREPTANTPSTSSSTKAPIRFPATS